MSLPENEYFALEEIEERWNIRRLDTVYYAENGLLEVATRVVGVVIETGIIETEPDGRWCKLLEDHARYSGLLTLRACDLATIFRRGSAVINFFDSGGGGRYGDVVEPADGVEVRVGELVVTRGERDRFERLHALGASARVDGLQARPVVPPIDCSDDGGWITVHGRGYLFAGLLQKTAIRRLYESWARGTPKLNMQALLEEIESGSRHISQVFGSGNRNWRDIVGYGRGYVWLKTD